MRCRSTTIMLCESHHTPKGSRPMSGYLPLKEQIRAAMKSNTLESLLETSDFKKLGELGVSMAELHNGGETDVMALLDRLVLTGPRDHVRLGYALRGFAAAVKGPATEIWGFFQTMMGRASGSSQYQLRDGIAKWVEANLEQAVILADRLRQEEWQAPLVHAFLSSWGRNAPTEALPYVLALGNDPRVAIRQAAASALTVIGDNCANERNAIISKLEDLLDDPDTRSGAAVGSAFHFLVTAPDSSAGLIRALEGACNAPSIEVRTALISGMLLGACPDPLRDKVFQFMKTADSTTPEILYLIDGIIDGMDFRAEGNVAADLLTAILAAEERAPSLKSFHLAIDKMRTSGDDVLGWFAVNWLRGGDPKICAQVLDLFQPLDRSIYQFNLDDFELNGQEVLYLLHKIFGYMLFTSGPAVSLFYACLAALAPEERPMLEDKIVSFWFRNYPRDIELLETVSKTYPRSGLDESVKRIRFSVDEYERSLDALAPNPALRPSLMERRIQAEIARERGKDVYKQAEAASIVSSLLSKSTLLYGRSSVTYFYPTPDAEPVRQVVALQEYETSATLPRLYVLHPARFDYFIRRFKSERRPV
ncbi:hypothetical protein [Rhizobium sp. LjRoot258]|uniref:hypothetical protein n=1 Tax=Rhizobium sp. LjRoot258 TaxID=3342299 RepID=UPI003ED0E87F